MSDNDLLYSGPGTVTPENPVLTPHNLQILQWMIQPAAEGLLILSGSGATKLKKADGFSGE
ncbi:hypothetical protein MIL71_004171 [Salmonella enterica subsp. enterica serovar Reading]|nr:hypothetical protein [Salmonella enterica subsp. enterica serovar Reading]